MADSDLTLAKKQPKIIGYMSALYDVMSTDAQEVEGVQVWQGRLIETCTKVGIPVGYYKRVVDTMKALGCVEMLARGRRGSTLTAIALRYPPTQELYDESIVKSGWEGLTDSPSLDTVAAQLKDIQTSLGGLHIASVLSTYETRFQELETAVKNLASQLQDHTKSNTTNKGE